MQNLRVDEVASDLRLQCFTPQTAKDALHFDVNAYRAILDDHDLTEEQKTEFVKSLVDVIIALIDIDYGFHPIQSMSATIH